MNESLPSAHGEGTASRRVAAGLRAAIDSGELEAGAQLPSERELAALNGVARNTAREAIRQLAEAGLVTPRHGKGVFVRNKPRLLRLGEHRYSRKVREATGVSPFHAEVLEQGRIPNATLTSIQRVAPPAGIAERLGLTGKTKSVVRRENWYFADGEPMQIGVTWIPWAIARGSELSRGDELGSGDLYARFADLGYEIARTREEVIARMPTPEEARGLMLPEGVPVLVVLHTGIDQNDEPFEVTEFVMRADYMGLDYRMPVDD